MYCRNCGKFLPNNVQFCPNCGCQINNTISNKITNNKNNLPIILACLIIIFSLIIVIIMIPKNNKKYLTDEDKNIYCNEDNNGSLCHEEVENPQEEQKDFESMDFKKYDFSETSSSESFYNSVLNILKEKEEEGNEYCNNASYTKTSNDLNNKLNLNYSYLCGMDTKYLTGLVSRLESFYKNNNIDGKIVDAYVVGKGSRNEYANYTGEIIGSNDIYAAYLRRVHMSIHMFSDYDKLLKTYQRDLEGGFHPKNSKAEDIVVHETAHALDFYISASHFGIDELIVDDFSKYSAFYSEWGNQSYSKSVVQKAVSNVNDSSSIKKDEQTLRKEISGYAATINDGTVMYAETFAEALVDYLSNGNNASPLSIEIYKIVQDDLKKLEG